MNKTAKNKNVNEDVMLEKSNSDSKIEKVRKNYDQWIQSASAEQILSREKLIKSNIEQISEATEDELIVLDDPLLREIDYQILDEMEVQNQLDREIEKLRIELHKNSEKLNQLKEIKLSVVSKKYKISPTIISYPFALVENRRQLQELLKKIIPGLKKAPIVQLEIAKMISSLFVLPKFEETLEKCQVPQKFGFDIINEILNDRNNFFRIIEEIKSDEIRCHIISTTNPDKYNSCFVVYAGLLNSLNKSSAN